ncbi:Nramp family divalent metal transporter [Nocardioides ginsengisoli]|uniref:Nramp family divalent metal transporter n=1 Tax=Nocardioides ginsengisoli TaxID=363868 RepID=A0ABW3VXS5_9ACTN
MTIAVQGRRRMRLAKGPILLGPAFVAGIAYVDPGNVATNTAAGSRYGYLLVWVVVCANLLAMLVQYLSAKVGIATGRSLPQLCREHYSRRTSGLLWLQAEAVALATDLAEVLGGALALHLLFGVPLLVGGVITGLVSMVLLVLQKPATQHRYERAIIALLAVIVLGFLWSAFAAGPSVSATADGLVPRFQGTESILLATGMLGATVMPHAIYLHSALVVHRFDPARRDDAVKTRLLRTTRTDVLIAMTVAGVVNLSMVLLAAAALGGLGVDTIEGTHAAMADQLGAGVAVLFALALLASGFASSSVGTYAGTVILDGFLRRRLALPIRRLITLAPALVILGLDVDPTRALVISQVVLSFGIPFALFPLVRFTRDRGLMGRFVNTRLTTTAATATAVVVSGLNGALLWLTFA